MKLLRKKYLTYNFLWQIRLVAGKLAGMWKSQNMPKQQFFALQEQIKL
jgi:hypothetical protein